MAKNVNASEMINDRLFFLFQSLYGDGTPVQCSVGNGLCEAVITQTTTGFSICAIITED